LSTFRAQQVYHWIYYRGYLI